MEEYRITLGYYSSVDDWKLSVTSWKDEDDHYKWRRETASGENPKDCARRYFEGIMDDGGEIIRCPDDDPYEIAIKYKGIVCHSIAVWTDSRTSWSYRPHHFYK